MNDTSPSPNRDELADDRHRRAWPRAWSETTRVGHRTITRVFSYVEPVADTVWVVEHDRDRAVYRVTGPDGKTLTFHDQPTRYLEAVLNTRTGEMQPMMIEGSHRQPRCLVLCPEEV